MTNKIENEEKKQVKNAFDVRVCVMLHVPAHWILNIDWLDVLTNIVSIRIQFRRTTEIWESNRRKNIRILIFAQYKLISILIFLSGLQFLFGFCVVDFSKVFIMYARQCFHFVLCRKMRRNVSSILCMAQTHYYLINFCIT